MELKSFFGKFFGIKKSQMDLFGGTPVQPKTPKKMTGLNVGKPSEKEAKIGDVKNENGTFYIFLETTIGKPRWHRKEELFQMKKEGKPIPKVAQDKIPALKEEPKKKKPDQLSEAVTKKVEASQEELGLQDIKEEFKGDFSKMTPQQYQEAVVKLSKLDMSELRKQQSVVSQQQTTAYERYGKDKSERNLKSLFTINVMAEMRINAIDRKNFNPKGSYGESIEDLKKEYNFSNEKEPSQEQKTEPKDLQKKNDEPISKSSTDIPQFNSTEEAHKFGKTATPEQIEQLGEKRKQALLDTKVLREERKIDDAIVKATEAQFYREAMEAAPKESEEKKEYTGDFINEGVESAISSGHLMVSNIEKLSKDDIQQLNDLWEKYAESKVSSDLKLFEDKAFEIKERISNDENKPENKNDGGISPEGDHKVGDIITIGDRQYQLNKNHRWERINKEEKQPYEITREKYVGAKDWNLNNWTEGSNQIQSEINNREDTIAREIGKEEGLKGQQLKFAISKTGMLEKVKEKIKTDKVYQMLQDKQNKFEKRYKEIHDKNEEWNKKITEHRNIISQAIKDNKTIPEEVLKDYPDLAKKIQKEKNPTEKKLGSLTEQVEQRLDEKQEKKEFKDIGKRVGGSKKEIAAIKAITMNDLEKMDNATAYKVVTKDRILPDIDVEQRRLNGELPGVVFLKKKLHEAVSAKPANTPEARKAYVELVPKIFEKIDQAKTIDEIETIGRDMFERMYSFRGKPKVFLKGSKDTDVEEYLGSSFLNLIAKNSDSAKQNWNKAMLANPLTEEDAREIYNHYLELKKNNVKHRLEQLDIETSDNWDYQFRNDPVIKYSMNGNVLNKMKKEEPEKYEKMISDYKEKKYKEVKDSVPDTFDQWQQRRPQYLVRSADWTWNEKKNRKVVEQAQKEMQIHDNPPLAYIKRTNGREVKASNITPEAIKNELGFSSVQFGNYVKDEEAKEHIKHFIGAIYDLEDILGIDMKKVNQLGNLSMSFGARGSGKFAAHYEPMSKIVNLTKTKGDGTVAHEFHHFFDHLFNGMREGTSKENIYTSQLSKIETPIQKEMKNVMDTIKKGDFIEEKVFKPEENKYAYGSIRREFEQHGLEGAIKYVEKYNNAKGANDYYSYIAKLAGKEITIPIKTNKTRFYKTAQDFNSDYWQRPFELFARATESFIQDKLAEKGMYNNYLVNGNDITQPDAKWGSESLGITYPQGEERKKINEAIDKLWKVAIKELNIGLDKEKEGKRVSSEIKIEKSFTTSINIFNFSNKFQF